MSRALWHQYKKIHREKKKEQERETEYILGEKESHSHQTRKEEKPTWSKTNGLI